MPAHGDSDQLLDEDAVDPSISTDLEINNNSSTPSDKSNEIERGDSDKTPVRPPKQTSGKLRGGRCVLNVVVKGRAANFGAMFLG